MRQLPEPSASAWMIDLTEVRGPMFVVLRVTENQARERLVEHLLALGVVGTVDDAGELVADARVEAAVVVW